MKNIISLRVVLLTCIALSAFGLVLALSFWFVLPLWQSHFGVTVTEAIQAGDYDNAILSLEQAIEDGEDDPELLAQLIQAYALRGTLNGTEDENFALATPIIEKALEVAPDNISVLLAVGYAHETAGHYNDAANFYNQVLAQEEANTRALVRLAHTYEFLDVPEVVRTQIYKQLYLEGENENPTVLIALGNQALGEGTPEALDGAYRFFLAAAEHAQEVSLKAEAWTNASKIQLERGYVQEASDLAALAVETERGYAPALIAYGQARVQQGFLEEGLAFVLEAVDANPRHSNAPYAAGRIAYATGAYGEALGFLQDALSRLPQDNTILGDARRKDIEGHMRYTMSLTYDALGEREEALASLESAVALNATLAERAQSDVQEYGSFEMISDSEEFATIVNPS